MISSWTPPGTKVVCIDDSPCPIMGANPLRRDAVYTIDLWKEEDYVYLAEFPREPVGHVGTFRLAFLRNLFRPLSLPTLLTSLLDSAPTPARELEPA